MKDFQAGCMFWQNPKLSRKELTEELRRVRANGFTLIRSFVWWENTWKADGQYDFSRHDLLYDAAAEAGLGIMETLGNYVPWRLRRDLAARGFEDTQKTRRYVCWDIPEYADPLKNFIEAAVRRYRNHPALRIWNLWNEPEETPCFCPHTMRRFAEWIRKRYPDPAMLKEAWEGEYDMFSPNIFPFADGHPSGEELADLLTFCQGGRLAPLYCDFLEFHAENTVRQIAWMRDIVRSLDPGRECHANPWSAMLNSCDAGLDEWKAGEVLDSIGASNHPSHIFFDLDKPENFRYADLCVMEMSRSWAGEKDAWISELQAGVTFAHANHYAPSPGMIFFNLLHAPVRGLRGLLLWEWQSWRAGAMEVGEFSLRRVQDGGPTERSEAAEKALALLKKVRPRLAAMKTVPAQAAILYSFSAERMKATQQRAKPHLPICEEHNQAVYACFKALAAAGIRAEIITDRQLENGEAEKYAVLFAPHVEMVSKATAEAVRRFVRNGGALYADGRFAFLDDHMFLRGEIPGHGLSGVFGCSEADFRDVRPGEIIRTEDGAAPVPFRHLQLLTLKGARASAFVDGEPVASIHSYGKGVAALDGTLLTLGILHTGDPAAMARLARFAAEHGAEPDVAGLKPEIVSSLACADDGDFLAVLTNLARETQTVRPELPAWECLRTDGCAEMSGDGSLCLRSGETVLLMRAGIDSRPV